MALTPGSTGLGTWAIGGHPPRRPPLPDASLAEIVEAGIAIGASWIDTAPVYGLGRVETLLGKLRQDTSLLDDLSVVTKCGVAWTTTDRGVAVEHRGDATAVRRDCIASLRRLEVDVLDCLLLHWPDDFGIPVAESWQTLLELRDEGKVRHVGVSNLTLTQLDECLAIEPPFAHQYSARASREVVVATTEWGAAHGVLNMIYGLLKADPFAVNDPTGSSDSDLIAPHERLSEWRRAAPDAALLVGASSARQVRELGGLTER